MQKNSSKPVPSKRFLQVAQKTKSWHPVARNGWIIKFSIFDGTNFLLTVISQYTGQAAMRYFTSEEDACAYINYIQNLDAEQQVEL